MYLTPERTDQILRYTDNTWDNTAYAIIFNAPIYLLLASLGLIAFGYLVDKSKVLRRFR